MQTKTSEDNASGHGAGFPGATGEISVDTVLGPWVVEYLDTSKGLKQVFLRRGEQMTIGSRGDVDLRLNDNCVSAVHCLLDATKGGLELMDLGSRNGVFLGGARIARARLERLTSSFTIGKTTLSVRLNTRCESREVTEPIAGLVGRSEPIVRLTGDIRRVAKLRAPVLIIGESGVGKDVVARSLHTLSARSGAYVPLNVAAIAESLSDSELFGHCRGAFTGAVQPRVGAFEQANGGTLFLDEIGELAPAIQAKLLRVLEDGMVRSVGAAQVRHVDVRVVSATCAPLGERCASGQFRNDLLHRLSVMILEVPPLRERKSDIPLLVQSLLERHRGEVGVHSLAPDALARLSDYEWPGNVRELGAVIYRACVNSESSVVDGAAIERALCRRIGGSPRRRSDPMELLTLAEGNVSRAARLAGLPRTTFRTWLSRTRQESGLSRGAEEQK
jgi:DNA-binding NtrC family response regulator